MATLEQFAPLPLQESYDNAGLQVGLTEAETSGVLLCLDVTEEVIAEAARLGFNLVVSHHPLLFHGLKCVSNATPVQRCVRAAIAAGITVYAAHTNLDNAPGGVNFEIARRIGLGNVEFLAPGTEACGVKGGSGIVGTLPQEEQAAHFLQRIKAAFGAGVMMHNRLLERPVRRVALCGGAGDFLLDRAVEAGADAFLTGEMHYHQYFGYDGIIQIGVFGHYETEQFTSELLRRIIAGAHPQLPIRITASGTNPIHYI